MAIDPRGAYEPKLSDLLSGADKSRRTIGLVLWTLGNAAGAMLLIAMFLIKPLFTDHAGATYGAMLLGAVLAFPACMLYALVPKALDPYDPEPLFALLGCMIWGGVAACGFSALINTGVGMVTDSLFGPAAAEFAGTVVSAPFVEEFWKGLALFGMFVFLRREFDGVVDGIIYGTFAALGFAAVENVVYYARAALSNEGALVGTVIVRGILAPWGHPLYTSMTGIGFGLARETKSPVVRILAPLAGYCAAVFLHALWNGSALVSQATGVPIILFMLPLWFLFVFAFFVTMVVLVRRKGAIIRKFLEDEVHAGFMSHQEVAMATGAWALGRTGFGSGGSARREFIAAAGRLALSKWHVSRSMSQGPTKATMSMDFIVPLRQRIAALRAQMYASQAPPQNYPYRR